MQPIRGVVQHYDWGDRHVIPALLGVPADGRPWAELWLGTHPRGPATLPDGRPLEDVTGPLPFLLKVLAAAEPLSLQTHPDAARAERGFAAGRYADPEPKPELLCAIGDFEALCGVRPVPATLELLDELGADQLAAAVRGGGPAAALRAVYGGRIPLEPVLDAAAASARPEAVWATRLAGRYPGDPSVVATLLLNLVRLAPGEAIALRPGNLHAYLGGAGVELMGPSDNVVRGGLTAKPVDVEDLLDVVDPTPLADPVLAPAASYQLPGTSVRLLRVTGPATHGAAGTEVAVTSAGRTGVLLAGERLDVADGETAYVAACG